MDRIEFALRRYKDLVPTPGIPSDRFPVRRLQTWLADDVGAVAAEYARRARFRAYAAWSVTALRAGSGTAARGRVDAVDAALVRHARLLRAFLRSTRGTAAGRSLPPEELVDETVSIDAGGSKLLSRTVTRVDRLPRLRASIEGIAGRFWADLVSADDYFFPCAGWMERNPAPGRATAGEFVVSLNPELHHVGDFVARCLLRRVDVLVEVLGDARRSLLAAAGREKPTKGMKDLAADAPRLADAVRALNADVRDPDEAPRRDACVTLTQAYAAFHQAPSLDWLEIPAPLVELGRCTLRHRLTNVRSTELVDRVAAALGDLRQLYADEPPGRAVLDEALARCRLVVTEDPPAAYWDGSLLSANWSRHRRPWQLLLALARKARVGASVDVGDVYDGVAAESALPTLLTRLRELVPAALHREIRPGSSPRSYRLTLPSDQVHVLTAPVRTL